MHKGYKREIPTDWKSYQIRDAISFTGGSQPPLSTFVYEEKEGYVRLIQTRDYRTDKYKTYIREEDAKKTCTSDDIIIGRYGPPLFQIFRGLEGAYNVALLKAIPDEKKILKDYCFYYLSRPELQNYLEGLSQRSGGQTGVEMDMLYKYPLPLPPFPEQQKIAEILSTWDDSIRITKDSILETKKRNKGLAQQLLTGKKRLNGFNGKWKHLMIGQIAKPLNLTNKKNEDIEVLSCTKYDGLVPSLEYFGRQVFGEDLSKYKIVPNGTFAYATNHIEEGSIGYQNLMGRGLVSPMYTVFETKPGIDDEFLFKLLKSEKLIYSYQSNMSGSINRRGGLRWGDFSKIKIDLPDYNEQIEIAKILNEAKVELKILEEKLETLLIQKKGLMQQLLTGEKRVTI